MSTRRNRKAGVLGPQPKTRAGKAFSFPKLVRQLKSKKGVRNPNALAAYIARKRSR